MLMTGMRYLFAAAASAFVLPLAQAIGWGWTMTAASILVVSHLKLTTSETQLIISGSASASY